MENNHDESDAQKNIKLLTDLQKAEATLHWQRNGFFLLTSSILLVALGQFHLSIIGLAFGILGLMMNGIWLLIQYRSSKYTKFWKNKVRTLEDKLDNKPELYPKDLKGVEMRILAMLLPLPLMMIWAVVLGLSVHDISNNVYTFSISSSPLNGTMVKIP